MGAIKKVTFTVEIKDDFSDAVVTQDSDTDLVTMTYIWVKMTQSLATQSVGDNKAVLFVRKVYNDFKTEFGMS